MDDDRLRCEPCRRLVSRFLRDRFDRRESRTNLSLVGYGHLVWGHADRTMTSGVIRIHQILQYINVTPRIFECKITVHFRLQRSVKYFHHGSFDVFVVTNSFPWSVCNIWQLSTESRIFFIMLRSRDDPSSKVRVSPKLFWKIRLYTLVDIW